MDEAIKLADRICIMSQGEIIQFDSPNNILKIQLMISYASLSVKTDLFKIDLTYVLLMMQ